jgi:hypothetical protein
MNKQYVSTYLHIFVATYLHIIFFFLVLIVVDIIEKADSSCSYTSFVVVPTLTEEAASAKRTVLFDEN